MEVLVTGAEKFTRTHAAAGGSGWAPQPRGQHGLGCLRPNGSREPGPRAEAARPPEVAVCTDSGTRGAAGRTGPDNSQQDTVPHSQQDTVPHVPLLPVALLLPAASP